MLFASVSHKDRRSPSPPPGRRRRAKSFHARLCLEPLEKQHGASRPLPYQRSACLEPLEERTMLTVLFTPQFGAETVTNNGGNTLSSVPLCFVFWGSYWTQGNGPQEQTQILNATSALCSSGFFRDEATEYGTNGVAEVWDWANNTSNPQSGFNQTQVQNTYQYEIQHGPLPNSNNSHLPGEPEYIVVTPPGVQSNTPNAGSYNSGTSEVVGLDVVSENYVWLGSVGSSNFNINTYMTNLSHEVAESIVNPYTYDLAHGLRRVGYSVTPGASFPNPPPNSNQICDYEAQNYTAFANSELAQSYWSAANQAYIIPDGLPAEFFVNNGVLTVTGTDLTLPNTFSLTTDSVGDLQVQLTDQFDDEAEFPPGEITSVKLTGGSAGNTVHFGAGVLGTTAVSFSLPGGSQPFVFNSNQLTVQSISSGDSVALGQYGSGGVQAVEDGQTVQFDPGLINSMFVDLGSGNNTIQVNGDLPAIVSQTFFSNSGAPGSNSLTIDNGNPSNFGTYTIGGPSANPLNINYTGWLGPLDYLSDFSSVTLNLADGSTGNDVETVNVERVAAGTTVNVNLGLGIETVSFGDSNGVNDILGNLNIADDPNPGSATIYIVADDQGDTTARFIVLENMPGQAGWGSITGLGQTQINYQYSAGTTLTVDSDSAFNGVFGNSINVHATGVATDIQIDAVTYVTLGNAADGSQDILGSVSMSSYEGGTPDEGNLYVNINDLADATPRTATLTTFAPTVSYGDGIFGPDTPWASISGLTPSPATISYEYADTTSVTIEGNAADQIVNHQTGSGAPPVTLNSLPVVTSISPKAGPLGGGTVVTINGSSLGSPWVLFGGNSIVFLDTNYTNTSTQIHVIAPSMSTAGTVDVRVGTSVGVSAATPADQFTYVVAPSITSLSYSAGPLNETGSELDIFGGDFAGATAVKFGGAAGTIDSINEESASQDVWEMVVTPPSVSTPGTVNVTVTTAGGTSNAKPFTYTSSPVVSSISPSAGPLGGGTIVTLSGANLANVTSLGFGPYGGTGGAITPGTIFASQFISQSATQIKVASPNSAGIGGAGTLPVEVDSSGGFSTVTANDYFTYQAPPTVTSISPNYGPWEDSTAVTITGTNLNSIAPVVHFGSLQATVESDNGTQIVALSPASAFFVPVDVTVSTAGGTSATSSADKFTYERFQPIVSGVSPSQGLPAGGTSVTITGNYFDDAQQVYFGAAAALSFQVVSDSKITAVSPAGTAGARVDVTVAVPGLQSATSPADAFTYELVPVVTAVNPTSGPASGGATVIVSGNNLGGATQVDFGGVAATIVAGTDTGSQIEVDTSPGSPGTTVDVTVATAEGTSATSAADQYTYNAGPPVVTGISPTNGPVSGGTTVTIYGGGLLNPSAVDFGTTPATIVSSTNGQVVVQSPAAASAGAVDVTVTTAAGTSADEPSDQFLYGSAPEVYGIYNGNLSQLRTTGPSYDSAGDWPLDVYGANLAGATEVDFGATKVTTFSYDDESVIELNAPDAPPGTVDVRVVTPLGTSSITSGDEFTFEAGPYVSSIQNDVSGTTSGPTSGGEMVTIFGDSLAGATAVNFGGTTVTSLTYYAFPNGIGGELSFLSPAGSPGVVNVTVTTFAGTSSTAENDQFTFIPPPTVTGVFPDFGPTAGGNTVDITGTNFYSSDVEVSFGGIVAYGSAVDSGNVDVVAPAGAAPGPVDVTVTIESASSATSPADQYTYIDMSAPAVTGLSANSGPLTGGTLVVISGAGLQYATAVDFGGYYADFTVNADGTLTATSPDVSYAGNVGSVDVTVTTPAGTSTDVPADQFTYVPPPSVSSISPTSGSVYGGSVVTIVGSDLAGATEVDFGANAGTITGNIDNQGVDTLTVLSPEATSDQPGYAYITVTTPYGSQGGLGPFNYGLPPTVSGLSQSTGPAAGGTYLTIFGSNLSTAAAVDFGSVPATSFSWDPSSGGLDVVSPADSLGTVDVTVTTTGGTTPVVSADQFTYLPPPTVTTISPSVGPASGGTSVTIVGTGLADATEVDFGYDPASFTVNPDGSITATSPYDDQGPSVDVTVVTPEGTSATSAADQFTYASVPSVSRVSPAWGNARGGDVVTITGSGLAGASAVKFGNATGSIVYDGDGEIQAVSPAGAVGQVDVTVVTAGGTSATLQADKFTYIGAPLAVADTYATSENTPLNVYAPGVLANDSDPQGDTLTANLLANPANGVVSLGSDGSFTYTPNSGFFGADAFVYQAYNGYLTSQPTFVVINVYPPGLTWDGTASGHWSDAHWVGGGPAYPNATVNATVDTASVVQVTSSQAAQALAVTDSGTVAVAAGGSLAVTGDSSVTGGALLSVDPNGSFSTGGTLTLDTGGSVSGGPVTAAAYQLNDGTASASLSGPGSLIKDTGGTVTLSGANSYAGGTVVDNGTLIVANAGGLPAGSSLTVGAGAGMLFAASQATSSSTPAGVATPAANVVAAFATSPPIIEASTSANPSLTTSIVATVSPFLHGPVERQSYGPFTAREAKDAPSVTAPPAMSTAAVDAVFTSQRSDFDKTGSPAESARSAATWAWFAKSPDQNQKADPTVAALAAVLARRGV